MSSCWVCPEGRDRVVADSDKYTTLDRFVKKATIQFFNAAVSFLNVSAALAVNKHKYTRRQNRCQIDRAF